ncbi:MAG TPA: universal stress protein, partial [Burkholderiales bacterium]
MNTTAYKFVLAIDGSAHANRAAGYLVRHAAKLRACEVHVVNVLAPRLAGLLNAEQQSLILESGAETEVARRMLDAEGIAYRFHSEFGDPAERIVEIARAEGAHEIIVGSRGMSALDSLAVGSVAYKVVHLSPLPVTVGPNPTDSRDFEPPGNRAAHRILLAADGSDAGVRAARYVCAQAQARVPVEVRLLNVQIPIASGNVRRFVSQEMIDNYCRSEGELALAGAKQVLQAADVAFKEDIQTGHAGEVIVREAAERCCSRIVMGTRGMGALANIILGSTALQVLHRSELPVTL